TLAQTEPSAPRAAPASGEGGTEAQLEVELAKASARSRAAPLDEQDRTEVQTISEEAQARRRAGQRPEVPGYEGLEKLGEGTYGEVWLAREAATGVRVAIKFLAHGTSLQWQLLQAEVKQLALLSGDPGIVQLRDVEPHASPPYYVMDYAERGSLARLLEP